MPSLPVSGCVAFRSLDNDKFVRLVHKRGQFSDTLKLSGDDVSTPFTRFYLDPSTKHDTLVHIRSCYNNKYWVPKKVNDSWYIIVDGKEPKEDKKDESSCTLFYLDAVGNNDNSFRISPCSSLLEGRYIKPLEEEHCLVATTYGLRFMVCSLDEDKVLPKFVRFKGDNGKYLVTTPDGDDLRYIGSDPFEQNAIHSIHPSCDGSFIRIKCEYGGRFWKCHPSARWIDSRNSPETDDHWFEVVKLDSNMIALRTKGGNKKFIGRREGLYPYASNDTINEFARLQLEEAILTRKIYNVQYNMDAARFYDHQPLVMATAHSVNSTSTETIAKLNLKYGQVTTSSWSTSTNKRWDVHTTIHAGLPKVSIGVKGLFSIDIAPDLGINIQRHYEQISTEENRGSQTHTEEQSVKYDMKVPPRTKMTLQAIATQVSYDIPYSYSHKDVLANGNTVVSEFEDGLFQGVSSYEFTYKVTEEKLSEATEQDTEESRKQKEAVRTSQSAGNAD